MSSERIEQNRSNIIEFSPQIGGPRKSHGPGGEKFRLLFHFLVFAVLLAAGFCIVRPVALVLGERMDALRDQLLDQGEALIDRHIEYE
ncbi:MAG: hypothetical protein LBF63_00345, partial [Treponema sp.]|nr:hypothetical protein [Treponema sp.]